MKSLLRYLAYSYVTLLTVTAPGQSIATGVLLRALLSREALTALSGLADSLLRRLPFDLK